MSYWLDSDVLVFAKDNIAPLGYEEFGFWTLLDRNIQAGFIKITKRNFQEITEGRKTEDDLARWLKLRKGQGVCVAPNKQVQAIASRIGDFVYSNDQYYQRCRARFAKGADAWLIAQAAIDGGTVVTRETSAPEAHNPKIPDLCKQFGVRYISLIELMKIMATPPPSPPQRKKGTG